MITTLQDAGFIAGLDTLWTPEQGWGADEEKASGLPFLPQYLAALDLFTKLFVAGRIWVHLAAEMQAGKTGVIAALIRMMFTNFGRVNIRYDHIFVITGMSDNEWKVQTRTRLPNIVRDGVQHSGGLVKVKASLRKLARGGHLSDVLIVVDESHIAGRNTNRPYKEVFAELRTLCPQEHWATNNIKIVTVSATDPALVLQAGEMPATADVVRLSTTDAYQSVQGLMESGRIHQTRDLGLPEHRQAMFDFIATTYGDRPLYHIIRPKASQYAAVMLALRDYRVIPWDAVSKASAENASLSSGGEDDDAFNAILSTPPDRPTFIVLKNMFYAAKTFCDEHVGVLVDRPSASKDDTTLQSLLGRACGYGKSGQTHVFTNLSTVRNYLKLWRDLEAGEVIDDPDLAASKLHKKMAGVHAGGGEDGAIVLGVDASRVPLIGDAPPPVPAKPTKQFDVQVEEFATIGELSARWTAISGETRRFLVHRAADGRFKSSLGEASQVQTDIHAVREWLRTKGVASWGSALTETLRSPDSSGKKLSSIKVAYDGDRPVFFLRWLTVP